MKRIILYISLFAVGTIGFMACKKEADYVAEYTTTENMAFLRVIHGAPFFRQMYNVPDSFNVYVNGNKINSPFLSFGSTFPGSATNYGYVAVPTGLQQIKLSVHGFNATNPDSTLILNTTKVFTTGQYYTYIISDSVKFYADQAFIPDAFSKPLSGNVNIRLINAVLNDTAGKVVDIFSYARNNTVITNVRPGLATAFGSIGYNIGVADTLYVTRPAAAGTPISGRIVLAKMTFAPVNQRTYSLFYRGDGNLTTGTKARALVSIVHQ